MLLAFIATFVVIMIKNRLNALDTRYTQIPAVLTETMPEDGDEDLACVEDPDGRKYFIKQDPLASVFRESPATLFFELRCQKADVFKTIIIPEVPTRQAKDFYDAFRLHSPDAVQRTENGLVYEFDNGAQNRLTRNLAFARRPVIDDKTIEARRKKKSAPPPVAETAESSNSQGDKQAGDSSKPKSRGRPKGSKNKATLLKEAANAAAGISNQPRKGQRGRPKGSKNKKTLAREAAAAKQPAKKKRRGRPIGSKNKPKTGQDLGRPSPGESQTGE